jgi:hypothetical protein
MAKSTIPTFKLTEVSDTRKRFLVRWRLERKLDLELRETQAVQEQMKVAENGMTLFGFDSRPFERDVCVGDIRLLRMSDTPDPCRFLYVAVLYVRDNFTSVVVPFSPYSVPACKDEWLTGLTVEPLRVLQFWNAQPIATKDLAQSWRTGHLTESQLEQALRLYKHAIDGSWPQGALREQTGLAILNPEDERLAYQREELALFTGLRGRLFRVGERASGLAKLTVQFGTGGEFGIKQFGHVYEKPERRAADSGDVYAEVIVLCDGGTSFTAKARREADATHKTVRWHIDGCSAPLLPGLPACLYARGCKRPLVAQGQTVGDGSEVSFKAGSEKEFSRLLGDSGLWIVIQSD